jgi:hypothetical protein
MRGEHYNASKLLPFVATSSELFIPFLRYVAYKNEIS